MKVIMSINLDWDSTDKNFVRDVMKKYGRVRAIHVYKVSHTIEVELNPDYTFKELLRVVEYIRLYTSTEQLTVNWSVQM